LPCNNVLFNSKTNTNGQIRMQKFGPTWKMQIFIFCNYSTIPSEKGVVACFATINNSILWGCFFRWKLIGSWMMTIKRDSVLRKLIKRLNYVNYNDHTTLCKQKLSVINERIFDEEIWWLLFGYETISFEGFLLHSIRHRSRTATLQLDIHLLLLFTRS